MLGWYRARVSRTRCRPSKDALVKPSRPGKQTMIQPDDSTFAQLMPLLPAHYRPLVGALVQENNELLERVRQRAQRNQHLLRRSLELMQRFITTLSPQDHAAAPAMAENSVLAVEAGLPLYDAIV